MGKFLLSLLNFYCFARNQCFVLRNIFTSIRKTAVSGTALCWTVYRGLAKSTIHARRWAGWRRATVEVRWRKGGRERVWTLLAPSTGKSQSSNLTMGLMIFLVSPLSSFPLPLPYYFLLSNNSFFDISMMFYFIWYFSDSVYDERIFKAIIFNGKKW